MTASQSPWLSREDKIPDFVQDAYKSSMRNCFTTMVDGLISASNDTEKKRVVERFKKCLDIHIEARDIYALLVKEE